MVSRDTEDVSERSNRSEKYPLSSKHFPIATVESLLRLQSSWKRMWRRPRVSGDLEAGYFLLPSLLLNFQKQLLQGFFENLPVLWGYSERAVGLVLSRVNEAEPSTLDRKERKIACREHGPTCES